MEAQVTAEYDLYETLSEFPNRGSNPKASTSVLNPELLRHRVGTVRDFPLSNDNND